MDELVLEVDSRRAIYEAVCRFPGIHLRELSRTVGLQLNLVDYHLHYLEKRDFIYFVQDGQFKRYFPKDVLGAEDTKDVTSAPDKPLVGLLRQQIPFRIAILLVKNGVMAHGDLVEHLHKAPSTVSHHLEKMIEAGVVSRTDDSKGYRLSDLARIERILISFNPHPLSLSDGFLEIWESLHL